MFHGGINASREHGYLPYHAGEKSQSEKTSKKNSASCGGEDEGRRGEEEGCIASWERDA